MTINDLVTRLGEICLNHAEVNSFNLGNTWDMAASKSSDVYPAVWIEQPILITYNVKGQKEYAFSMDVLMLPKQDNTTDEVLKQSQCESIADDLLMAFSKYMKNFGLNQAVGLTVKNLNADLAVGVRIDIKINTNRECDWDNDFKEVMVKE
jgi:hypothetical protein